MQATITVITLAVDDLQRALRFYRDGLGLATKGIIGQEFEHGAMVLMDLQPGLRLALWPRSSLAHDTGLAASSFGRSSAMSLGHNVASAAEVDTVMAQAVRRRCALRPLQLQPRVFTQRVEGDFRVALLRQAQVIGRSQ